MTQFHMIDADPAVTRQLFQLRDDAKQKAAKAEKLVYFAWIYRLAYMHRDPTNHGWIVVTHDSAVA